MFGGSAWTTLLAYGRAHKKKKKKSYVIEKVTLSMLGCTKHVN